MLERYQFILKIACWALGALLVFQVARAIPRLNPLANVSVPARPVFTSGTDASKAAQKHPASGATSSTPRPAKPADAQTGRAANSNPSVTSDAPKKPATATPAFALPPGMPPGMLPPGMRPGLGAGAGKAPKLSPPVQARVDVITESEILGPVIRPQPMALLGIAGTNAFLRAPNGQTGLVAEGDELGGIKLLRIGTNRVLIEQEGQPKELMIFAGFGGDSLLPKTKQGSK